MPGYVAGKHKKKTRFWITRVYNIWLFLPDKAYDAQQLKKICERGESFSKIYSEQPGIFFFGQQANLFAWSANNNYLKTMLH